MSVGADKSRSRRRPLRQASERALHLPPLLRYACSLAAVALAFASQYLLLPKPSIAPFVLFFFGVALASWLGGRVPGLISVALSAMVANYMFVPPVREWSTSGPALTATGLFVLGASATALLCAAFRDAALRVERAAEKLSQQAEMLNLSQDAVFAWQLEGPIESWNAGAQALYGYSAFQAIGRVPRELLRTVFPEPWPQIEAELRRQSRWEGELLHRTQGARTVTVWARLQLLLGSDGVERVLESSRDVTERKVAEEERSRLMVELDSERRRLETILEQNPVGLGIVEAPSGRLVYANARLYELLGAEALGDANWRLHCLDEAPCKAAQTPKVRALRGERVIEELKVPRPEASAGWGVLSVNAAPIRSASGQITGGVVALQDITERKGAEEALRKSEQRLRGFYEAGIIGVLYWTV
ncbi:MAG: PAS domain-containing protein, partial [Deltaproteobacteria bacterium]|nr:PAS domain-containing protein [Deltaproteobacteria bacterium]